MKKLFVLGDSISMHYGPYLARFVDGRYCYARKGMDPDAATDIEQPGDTNGGDSAMVRAYLADTLERGVLQADILLLNCGLHDIKTDPTTGTRQIEPSAYDANLRWIVDRVRRAGMRLVWVRTTPLDEQRHNQGGMTFFRFEKDQAAYNAAADRVMRELDVPMIDLERFTLHCGDPLFCDHVHFVDAVREKQAAYIAGFLDAMP